MFTEIPGFLSPNEIEKLEKKHEGSKDTQHDSDEALLNEPLLLNDDIEDKISFERAADTTN